MLSRMCTAVVAHHATRQPDLEPFIAQLLRIPTHLLEFIFAEITKIPFGYKTLFKLKSHPSLSEHIPLAVIKEACRAGCGNLCEVLERAEDTYMTRLLVLPTSRLAVVDVFDNYGIFTIQHDCEVR